MMTWVLKLADYVSGPAAKAAQSLGRVSGALKDVRRQDLLFLGSQKKAAAGMNAIAAAGGKGGAGLKAMGAGAGAAASGLGGKLAALGKFLPGALGSAMEGGIAGIASGITGLIGSLVGKVAGFGLNMIQAGAGFAWDQVLHIGQLQESKAATIGAFTRILKSGAEASRVYAMVGKSSFAMGKDLRESMAGMNSLLAQGFKGDFADQIMRAVGDLSVINPQANSEAIVRAISQVKNIGRLQGEEVLQLAEAGVSAEGV